MSRQETCARCGHQTPVCPRCDRREPYLGGGANGDRLCHTFSRTKPTCYETVTGKP